jgi:hypothetical protein
MTDVAGDGTDMSELTAVEPGALSSWADGATVVGAQLCRSKKKVRATPSVVDGREAQRKADITFDQQQQWQPPKVEKPPPQKDTPPPHSIRSPYSLTQSSCIPPF